LIYLTSQPQKLRVSPIGEEEHFGAMVPRVRKVIHQGGVFAPIVDTGVVLSAESTLVLIDSHVVVSVFEGRSNRGAGESGVKFLTQMSRLLLENFQFVKFGEVFRVLFGLENVSGTFIVYKLFTDIARSTFIHH
jgi:hypothetical protein